MEQRKKLIFVDIETGGRNRRHHPIIELAAIAVHAGTYEELDAIEMKIHFDPNECDPKALGINKFKPSDWKYALKPEIAAEKFSLFCKKHATFTPSWDDTGEMRLANLVAHNADFDRDFLLSWSRRHRVRLPISKKVRCTMQRLMWFFDENPSISEPVNHKNKTLCQYFHVDTVPDHTALNDIRATVELIRIMRRIELNAVTATAA